MSDGRRAEVLMEELLRLGTPEPWSPDSRTPTPVLSSVLPLHARFSHAEGISSTRGTCFHTQVGPRLCREPALSTLYPVPRLQGGVLFRLSRVLRSLHLPPAS